MGLIAALARFAKPGLALCRGFWRFCPWPLLFALAFGAIIGINRRMLILDDISVRIAGRLLIDHASVRLPDNSKTGFVGRNGAGKSTLFHAITGELPTETGQIILPAGASIGQVAQEAPDSDEALLDIVLAADTERAALLAEAETAADPMRIAEIHTRLADKQAHMAPARAAAILAGLGFDEVAQRRPAAEFSGGWRMRVALAAMLFAEPELLLLDEPTNYLDIEGVLWLTAYIRRYPHSAIIISHDRDLLNNAVTSILSLEHQKLTFWQGNYASFARQRAEKNQLLHKQAAKLEAKRKHMEDFVARFRAKATKARQAQSRLKMLEKMETITVYEDEGAEPFRFPQAEKIVASPIVHLSDVSLGYGDNPPVLQHLNLRIDKDDRIALLGANGNGKSTFAKFLAGRLKARSGEAVFAPNLKISFFAQHQMDDLYPEETPIEHFRRLLPQELEAKLRARVARTGLSREKMQTKAKSLSGGEKARLLMGLAVVDAPHLLILDEPTNHLDMDSRAELTEALNAYEGAVILIAHDRYLIESVADRLWKVANGTIAPYDGDMESYAREYLKETRPDKKKKQNDAPAEAAEAAATAAEMPEPAAEAGSAESGLSKAELRKIQAEKRAQTAPLRKAAKMLEQQIHNLTLKLKKLDAQLADPDFYQKPAAQITETTTARARVLEDIAAAESDWLKLQEQLEQAAE